MRPILLGFAAVALFFGSLVMAPLTSEVASSSCQPGQVVNAEQAGIGCETGCPPGMLDARTETCVAAPLGPPAL